MSGLPASFERRHSVPADRAALLLAGCLLLLAGCSDNPDADTPAAIHARLLTLDTHMDTPMMVMRPGWDFAERHDTLTSLSQVDLPRLREGGLDAGFWAVFVPQRALTVEGLTNAEAQAEEIFAAIHQLIDKYSEDVALATTPAQVRTVVDQGKYAVLIGVENGYALGGKLENVQRFYDLGARYIGLTHTKHNDLGASSTGSKKAIDGGLTDFGRDVVAEMNRVGIMVDVSHVADSTFWDILEVTTAPPIASHSSARAVYDHPRNLTDEQLRAVAERGGVVQVNTLSEYLTDLDVDPARTRAIAEMSRDLGAPTNSQREWLDRFFTGMGAVNAEYPPPLATLDDVADHIDHLVAVMGIDHVGVGADFDGGGGVAGMNDVSEMPNLTAVLLERGYTEGDLAKLWGGNLLRVMAQVQAQAETS